MTPDTQTVCKRCNTHRLACEYREHRRGRKRKEGSEEIGAKPAPRITRPRNSAVNSSTSNEAPDSSSSSSFPIAGPSNGGHGSVGGWRPPRATEIHFSHVIPVEGDSSPYLPKHNASVATTYLQPPGSEDDSNHAPLHHENTPLQDFLRSQCPDPIDAGLISQSDAVELFDFYFRYLNVTIAMLDPDIHSWHECRSRSPLLFTAVVAVTARIVRPRVYKSSLMIANKLVGEAVETSACSIEVVQALNILAQWKRADDSSSWRRVGYAIRMAQELKLHTKTPRPLPADIRLAREVLNKERTWLNLIIADYHLAIHHSLPRMMSAEEGADDPIEWITTDHPHLFTPGESILAPTVGFSRMCLLYADILTNMKGDTSDLRMLNWLELEWKRWKAKWLDRHHDFSFASQQVSMLKLFCAYYHFHICEYRLLYHSKYRASGQALDTSQPTPLSFAFGDCIDAGLGLSKVFQEDFAQPGYLTYCFNLTWVSLAVTSIWLVKNINAMTGPDRSRVIKTLADVQASTEEASRCVDDMPAYTSRLLKHLLSGIDSTRAAAADTRPRAQHARGCSSSGNGTAHAQSTPIGLKRMMIDPALQSSSRGQSHSPVGGHSSGSGISPLPLGTSNASHGSAFDARSFEGGRIGFDSTHQMIQEDLWTSGHPPSLGGPSSGNNTHARLSVSFPPPLSHGSAGPHLGQQQHSQHSHHPSLPYLPSPQGITGGVGGGSHSLSSLMHPPASRSHHTTVDGGLFPSNDDDIWKILFPVREDGGNMFL